MKEQLLDLIRQCVVETARAGDLTIPERVVPEMALLGETSAFDSMAIVNLIVALEDAIADSFGVRVTLSIDSAMSPTASPLRTVESLAAFAEDVIRQHRA